MTSKERAALRAQANGLEALFQIGKGGISDTLVAQTDDALRARELIKLRVLTETSPVSARDAADELAAKTGAEVVQVIGGVIVLYRYEKDLHTPKKTVVKVKTVKKKDVPPRKKSPFTDKKGREKRFKRDV
ncbi:MAG: YhbY family RNA-binding protein [Clostridia bacterium]|nr:YhbY family RNA-binding protein [Clostridia bacterium]